MTTKSLFLTSGRAAVLAVALALVGPAMLVTADAKAPKGSVAEVILESTLTGDPTHALRQGWWGHGAGASPTKAGATYVSLDLANSQGKVTTASTAALGQLFGDKNLDKLRVAFVPYSPDGSNERPEVHKGENAGQAFEWFTDLPFGTAWNGTPSANDSVVTVSTLKEWTAWWDLGRPLEGFLPDLSVVTISNSGVTQPAAAPEGKSILNRWPAGEKISMVFYVSDGYDKQYPLIPRVAVGSDGRAISAWLTFKTVANPKDPARTSAGFDVLTYSPPSAYAAGTKAGTSPGAAPTAAANASSRSPGSKASGPGGSDSKRSVVGRLLDAVPGGSLGLLAILLLLGLGAVVVVAVRRLRSGVAAAGAPPVADQGIPDESPAGETR